MRRSLQIAVGALALSLVSTLAQALPFNDDMVKGQLTTGNVVRPSVPGSIPVGSKVAIAKTREEALGLKNPVEQDEFSIERGARLYSVNCRVCHGAATTDPSAWGPSRPIVSMPGPNLGDKMYHSTIGANGTGRTDGQIYAQIHFGGAIMQRVGWKLSAHETWDIINYIRSIQKGE